MCISTSAFWRINLPSESMHCSVNITASHAQQFPTNPWSWYINSSVPSCFRWHKSQPDVLCFTSGVFPAGLSSRSHSGTWLGNTPFHGHLFFLVSFSTLLSIFLHLPSKTFSLESLFLKILKQKHYFFHLIIYFLTIFAPTLQVTKFKYN